MSFPFDLIAPVKGAVAAALAALHTALSGLGLTPGPTWALSIVLLVVCVRVALLPLVAHSVRVAHAAARARPALSALQKRYADRLGRAGAPISPADLRAMRSERRAIQAEHGVPSLGLLPVLLQLPLVFALYSVLSDVANRQAVGAMDAVLVASAGSASFAGVSLAQRWGGFAQAPSATVGIAALALVAALLSYAGQRWFVLPTMVLDGVPEQLVSAQRLMPVLSAAGVVAAAFAVPVGVLLYWVATNAWTLGQQAVIWRWFPTPGSPAYAALLARRAARAARAAQA